MPSLTNPSLRCYFNWLAREALPSPSTGWPQAIRDAGYDGIQFIEPLDTDDLARCRDLNLGACGSGRVNRPEDAFRLAEQARRLDLECLTLHVGWGVEDDAVADGLIEAILSASAGLRVPLYVETHRATIFQDMWRAVQFVRRYPDLRFNGDFSHWYTGQEMVYGDFEQKLAFIRPVLERTRFLHGRIGNPGSMQVDIGDANSARTLPYVQHFLRMWTEVFHGYLRQQEPEPWFCFAVELLAPEIYYARVFAEAEESDRWQQSLVLVQLARDCFGAAQMADSGEE